MLQSKGTIPAPKVQHYHTELLCGPDEAASASHQLTLAREGAAITGV